MWLWLAQARLKCTNSPALVTLLLCLELLGDISFRQLGLFYLGEHGSTQLEKFRAYSLWELVLVSQYLHTHTHTPSPPTRALNFRLQLCAQVQGRPAVGVPFWVIQSALPNCSVFLSRRCEELLVPKDDLKPPSYPSSYLKKLPNVRDCLLQDLVRGESASSRSPAL